MNIHNAFKIKKKVQYQVGTSTKSKKIINLKK